MKRRIAVVGGGITGVTTAYALSEYGCKVTLYEKRRYAGMETSFANGGQLSASNAEVWTHPRTLLKGIQWILRSDAPLLVRPRPSWHKLSWLAEFIGSIPRYERNTVETVRLALAARAHLFRWAERERIDFDLSRRGILHIYRDLQSFRHAEQVSKLLAQGGLARRAVSPSEMRQIEPTLHGNFYGGFFTESDSTGDIHKFTHGLASAARARGVEFLWNTDVTALRSDSYGVTVRSRNSEESESRVFDAIVICAGIESRGLAGHVGDRVNVYPVKGYSITVNLVDRATQEAAPEVSLLDDQTKIVTSRLGRDRFRVAGTAEFTGRNLDILEQRVRPLVRWVEECFPNVSTRSVVPWAGLRPMMPNMMPKVGRGNRPGVFYNTGHGHLGWTLSAATADIVARLVGGSLGLPSQ